MTNNSPPADLLILEVNDDAEQSSELKDAEPKGQATAKLKAQQKPRKPKQ